MMQRKYVLRAKCLRGGNPSLVEPRRGRQNLHNTSRATGAALADEGAKGVMLVDSPPHQPQKKKSSLLITVFKLAGTFLEAFLVSLYKFGCPKSFVPAYLRN